MEDQTDNSGPFSLKDGPSRRNGADSSPSPAGKAASPGDAKGARKKRGPVINRRGPSELDRVIHELQLTGNRSRFIGEGSVRRPASRGTIVRIDRARGFGFLIDSAGEHRFFHRSWVENGGFGALKEQQAVEFEARDDQRGARAFKVRPAGHPHGSGNTPTQPSQPSPTGARARTWRSDLGPFRSGTDAPTARGDRGRDPRGR